MNRAGTRTMVVLAAGALVAASCGGGGDAPGFGGGDPGADPSRPSGEEIADRIIEDILDGPSAGPSDPNDPNAPRALEVELQRVTGFGGRSLAADGDTVWVADFDNEVVRSIDTATATVGEDIAVGRAPLGIAADGAEVWVANSHPSDHTVMRIDAATGEIEITTDVGAGNNPTGVALTDEHLWVGLDGNGTLAQVDRRSGELVGVVDYDDALPGSGYVDVLVAEGSIWSIDRACGRVVRTDPDRGEVTDLYDDLGFEASMPENCSGVLGAAGPIRLAAFEGGIFVLAEVAGNTGRISRIDPVSGEVRPVIDIGFGVFPRPLGVPALVVEERGIWMSAGDRVVRMDRSSGRIDGVFTGTGFSVVSLVDTGPSVWALVVDSRTPEGSGLYGVDMAEAAAAAQ